MSVFNKISLFTIELSNNMEHSPSSEATKEIPYILWNPKVHFCLHKIQPLVPFLSQINAVCASPSHFLKIHFKPLNPELNPICYLLALLAHHFLHVSRIMVKSLTLRLPKSYIYIYIYMERIFLMFLDHIQRCTTVGRTPLDE